MTNAMNMMTYGRAKAIAQINSAPISSPCHVRRFGRGTTARPAASACWGTLMFASPGLCDHLREDLVQALESLVHRLSGLHAVLDDVGVGLAPELFAIGLAPGRRVGVKQRQGRVQHAFLDIRL